MTIRVMIVERLDGWRYQWGDFVEGAGEVELREATHDTFDDAVKAVDASIRVEFPKGTLQGDDDDGASDGANSGKRKSTIT